MNLINELSLKVGDLILFTYGHREIDGMIGEIQGNDIFIWNNNSYFNGSCGHIKLVGYKYSWIASANSPSIKIEKINADMLNKKSLNRITKKNELNRKV